MAELSIAVERYFGIQHAQRAVAQDNQRVDFQQAHVGFDKRRIEIGEQVFGFILGRASELKG